MKSKAAKTKAATVNQRGVRHRWCLTPLYLAFSDLSQSSQPSTSLTQKPSSSVKVALSSTPIDPTSILTGVSSGNDIITDPALVPVAAYEVVLEPDTEDGDPTGSLKYTIRVPAERRDG